MNEECGIYRTADFIGKRWTLLILLELYKGESKWKRYNGLKRSLMGITSKILSIRLKELEKQDIIRKRTNGGFPLKSEYSLTESVEDFIKIIEQELKN